MLDIKSMIDSVGINAANTAFIKPVGLPFAIVLEDNDIKGYENSICSRDITIEFYSKTISETNEKKIENLLNENSIEYKKNRSWIESEKCFQTIYDFFLYEKI